MTKNTQTFKPDWISPPGNTISDLLEEFSWSQTEFAKRMDYTTKHVCLLLQGEASITEDTALRLEKTIGGSVEFWMTREQHYKQALAEKEEVIKLQTDKSWLKELPIPYLLEHNLIKEKKDKIIQIIECLKFFGVASVAAWRNKYEIPLVEFRSSQTRAAKSGAVATWLRYCEKVCENSVCQPYNKELFKEQLENAKKLAIETDSKRLIPKLQTMLAKAGVTLIVKPTPPKCPIHGAAKWMSQNRALLMISTRYKTDDQFWFSFFHESAHILFHGKRQLYIDQEFEEMPKDKKEEEANQFAEDKLMPKWAVNKLNSIKHTHDAVNKFSKEIGIAPGIVIGRMQKEGLLPWNSHLNKLKQKLF